jgi:hypothetical protein
MRHAKLFAQINPPELVEAKAQSFRTSKPAGGSLLILTPKEAADLIGVNPSLLRRWRMVGDGPAYFKVYGRVLYDLTDVLEHIHSRRARIERAAK